MINLIRIHEKITTRKLPLLQQDCDFLLVSSDIPAQSGSAYQSKNKKEKLVTHSGKAIKRKIKKKTETGDFEIHGKGFFYENNFECASIDKSSLRQGCQIRCIDKAAVILKVSEIMS